MSDMDPARQANYERGIDELNASHPLSAGHVNTTELIVVIGRLTEALRETLQDYGRLKAAAQAVVQDANDVNWTYLRSVLHNETSGEV